jgi:hypothetical protein
MRLRFHGLSGALDVNIPGDLHLINCLYDLREKAPRCAGVASGEADIIKHNVTVEFLESGTEDSYEFEHIQCPDSCPRDEKSQRERCLIPR